MAIEASSFQLMNRNQKLIFPSGAGLGCVENAVWPESLRLARFAVKAILMRSELRHVETQIREASLTGSNANIPCTNLR
jgi:hypothetical protein